MARAPTQELAIVKKNHPLFFREKKEGGLSSRQEKHGKTPKYQMRSIFFILIITTTFLGEIKFTKMYKKYILSVAKCLSKILFNSIVTLTHNESD